MIVITPPPISPTVGSDVPAVGNCSGAGVLLGIVVVGVGAGEPQLQVSKAVHPGRRHIPDAQIKSDGQSAFVEHVELHDGPHVHESSAVHPGMRHFPDAQMRFDGH